MRPHGPFGLSLTLWTAAALLAARVALLFLLGYEVRGEDPDVVLWRIADHLPATIAHALAAAALAVVCARFAARAGWMLAGVLGVAAAAALLSALSGWPVADPYYVPGLQSGRGQKALAVLALAALFGGALLLGLWRAHRAGRALPARLGSRPVLLAGAALLLLGPAVFVTLFKRLPPTRTVRLRLVEVAFEPELWRAVHQRADSPVALGVVTPSLDYRVDGGDLPTLLMPPPAEVRFHAPADGEGLLLRASAGVDHRSQQRLRQAGVSATVGFEVRVDGEVVLDHGFELGPDRTEELQWSRTSRRGIPVRPGAEVVLRTTLERHDASEGASQKGDSDGPVVLAGFGELVLERNVERPRAESSPDAPNVLLVVMDTLRADRMSCYGYPLETTPHLDALAARGLVFDEAYATSSWTWPSTASILTGLLPETHQVVSDGSCYLDGKLVTLPEVLSERGYTTAAFTCNPLIVADKNFDQGFEVFDASPSFRKTDQIFSKVEDWLRMHRRERFFLYLHLVDPHWSYEHSAEAVELFGLGEPPAGFPPRGIVDYNAMLLRGTGFGPNGESLIDEVVPAEHRDYMDREYDAAVYTSDQYMGRILATLAALDLDDRTIVVFTSDHGEEILDHGLVTHGLTLHRELTRAPLILAGPSIPVGRVATRVSNRHLAPTLAAFGGAEIPGLDAQGGEPKGLLDLAGPVLLYDPGSIPEEPILFSTHQGWWKGRSQTEIYGLIEGEWEVHYAPEGRDWGVDPNGPAGDFRLYHLPSDPEQRNDLAARHPERAQDLIGRMMLHHRQARTAGREVRLGVGSGSAQLLRDIGYIGADEEPSAPEPPADPVDR